MKPLGKLIKLLFGCSRTRQTVDRLIVISVYVAFVSLPFLNIACNKMPVARIIVEPDTIRVMSPVNFDGSSSYDPDGEITKYMWDFDDGETGSESEMTHAFIYPDRYTVSLEVTDNKGKKGKSESEILIIPPDPLELVPDTASIVLSPDSTGHLAVTNDRMDLIELVLPAGAVTEPIRISLTALNQSISEGWDRQISLRIKIEPEGLVLKIPGLLIVSYSEPLDSADQLRIFNTSVSNEFSIVPWQNVSDTCIKGKVYHFSEFEVGTPEISRLTDLAGKMPSNEIFDHATEFDNTLGQMIELASLFDQIGLHADANSLREGTTRLAEKVADDILDQPLPTDPCGNYMREFFYNGQVLGQYLKTGTQIDRLRNRAGEILNQCPLKGNISFHIYSIPRSIEGGLSVPITVVNNSTSGLSGGGINHFWLGGPGFVTPEGTMKISAGGEVDNKVEGNFQIDPPFDVKLKVLLTMRTIEMYLYMSAIIQGQTIVFLDIYFEEGTDRKSVV